MPEHTHDAWTVGVHDIPDDASDLAYRTGDVIVHDLDADRWYVMTGRDFDALYEWV